MPWLCWELLLSMLCMNKGSSLKLDLMNASNYVVIMIMQVNGMKRFSVYEESSGRNSLEKYMRLVLCGYELILCDYTMPMFMLS